MPKDAGDELGEFRALPTFPTHLPEGLLDHVPPQHAIALKLCLTEPLVGGRLVGEGPVRPRVVEDVNGLGFVKSGFEIEQDTVLRAGPVHARILNRADGAILARLHQTPRVDEDLPQGDRHAEIDTNLTNRVAQVLEVAVRVTAR